MGTCSLLWARQARKEEEGERGRPQEEEEEAGEKARQSWSNSGFQIILSSSSFPIQLSPPLSTFTNRLGGAGTLVYPIRSPFLVAVCC